MIRFMVQNRDLSYLFFSDHGISTFSRRPTTNILIIFYVLLGQIEVIAKEFVIIL